MASPHPPDGPHPATLTWRARSLSDRLNGDSWRFSARKMGVPPVRWMVFVWGNPIVRNDDWGGTPMTKRKPPYVGHTRTKWRLIAGKKKHMIMRKS